MKIPRLSRSIVLRTICSASAFNASVTDSIFKSLSQYACARAGEVMSTESEADFQWSIKLCGGREFDVGIASQFKQENSFISNYDQNAILYRSYDSQFSPVSPVISIGSNPIHENLPNQKAGDVIRFSFQPQRKKLVIDLVRI